MFNKLKACLDIDVIGDYHPVESIYGPHAYSTDYSQDNIRGEGPIEFDLQLANLQLSKQAHFTDIIHHNYHGIYGLTISEDALALFEEHNTEKFSRYCCEVRKGDDIRQYWTIFIARHRSDDFICWKDCEFIEWQPMGHIYVKDIELGSYSHYVALNRRLRDEYQHSIKPLSLVIDSDIELEFFKLKNPYRGYYFSDQFCHAIKSAGLTGFEFSNLNEINARLSYIPPPWEKFENN